ncbi:MAG: hypothetical protein ACFHX7_25000 [Pseudomonadota bacterium]
MQKLIFLGSALLLSMGVTGEPHREVSAALNWQLPANHCEAPKLSGAERDVEDPTGSGARYRYDVDSAKLARYQRQQKRWEKCIERYKAQLVKDFGKLKDSARHGLTQEQANSILAKMALIQAVVESPTATPPE